MKTSNNLRKGKAVKLSFAKFYSFCAFHLGHLWPSFTAQLIKLPVMMRLFALLVLLCFGCSKKGDEWKHLEIVTGKIQYNSQRIYHPTEEIFCGLEYEIIRDHCTLRSYLNLFAGSVEGEPQNPQYVPVKLCIEEKPYTFLARRFCGGQRLLIPRPYTLLIISSLLSCKCCSLELEGGYFVMLTPSNFSHCWHSKPPLVPYPKFF